ncbi:MAG: S1 family peptidase, partial [Nevskiales bacterium]
MDSVDAEAAGSVCPKCGSPQTSATDCSVCGINFERFMLAKERVRQLESRLELAASAPARTAAPIAPAPAAQGTKCPACGHIQSQAQAASCEACGIYFEKYRRRQAATSPAESSSSPRPPPDVPVVPPVPGRPGKIAIGVGIGLVLLNIVLASGVAPHAAAGSVRFGFILGAVFAWPLLFMGIAAIWKRNRNRARVLLVFNIASIFVVTSLLVQLGRHTATTVAVAQKTTDSLSAAQLQELKRSIAYITFEATWSRQSGTGFLVHKDGDTGLVVTNAHVVRADKREKVPAIQVVFSSGESGAVEATAEIAAFDAAEDLALLRVRSRNLPQPIALSNTMLFAVTQDVLILGFPFGGALATSGDTPAITIGKGAVSSNRFNENGQIA